MLHKKIEIPKDNYYTIMSKLGSIDNSIEFEDLNKNEIEASKPHFAIINRCEEIESIFNRIDYILMTEFNISYDLYHNYKDFKNHLNFEINKNGKKILEQNFLDYIENIIIEDENKIKIQFDLNKDLLNSFHNLLEKKYIYEKMVELFNENVIDEIKREEELENDYQEINDEEKQMLNFKNKNKKRKISFGKEISLNYLCGICNTEDVLKLSRIIFRGGKGLALSSFYNATINDENIILDEKKYFENKQIFLIVIEGENPYIKIKNILEIFNCEAYKITNISDIQKKLELLNSEISEQKKVVFDSEKFLLNLIKNKTSSIKNIDQNYKSLYSLYKTFCKREKYIYMNLNKCKELNSFYIGDVWIPEVAFDKIKNMFMELLKENEDKNFFPDR